MSGLNEINKRRHVVVLRWLLTSGGLYAERVKVERRPENLSATAIIPIERTRRDGRNENRLNIQRKIRHLHILFMSMVIALTAVRRYALNACQ